MTERKSPWPLRLCITGAMLALVLAQCRGERDPSPGPTGAVAQQPPNENKSQDPKPIPDGADRVRFWISGAMEGHLEPCGCAKGQIGGLARRLFRLKQRPDQYDLRIEGGDLSGGGNELDHQKFFTSLQVLFGMGLSYHALGVGPKDLELPLQEWAGIQSDMKIPVVASDLRCRDDKLKWPAQPFREFPVRNQKVRIANFTMALPDSISKAEAPAIELLTPVAAWKTALEGAAPKTLRVLMVHAEPGVISKLLPSLQPPPDLVIAMTDVHLEPLSRPEMHGNIPVIYPGTRGRFLLDVTLTRLDDGPRIGYAIEPLQGSSTTPAAMQDQDVKGAVLAHRFQVKEDGVLQKMAGKLPTANGSTFVGSLRCKDCHQPAYDIWSSSKHGKAWKTLEDNANSERYPWPVTAYPDCVGCHTVGYRQQSGFVDIATTPGLKDVGCEQCHGAGKAHSDAPMKNKMGKVGGGSPALACAQCHDFEQSPDFNYKARWLKIQHK